MASTLPPVTIKAGGSYSSLAEERFKDPRLRNRLKIAGSLCLLLVVLVSLIASGANRDQDDGESDPNLFEQILESGPLEDQDDQITYDIDEADAPELPTGCVSRRSDHPGTEKGARIQFIHIPLAGGTSVEKSMSRWNHGSLYNTMETTVDGSNEKCTSHAMSANLLGGHRGFGFCKEVKESSRGLFTFVSFKHPVSRAVALFDLEKSLKSKFFTRVFGDKSLKDLLKAYNKTHAIEEGEAFIRFMGSQQTRFLCGYECFMPKNKTMNEDSFLIEKALENLQKVDAVGVTDRLNDLIPQLKLHLRWLSVGFRAWPFSSDPKGAVTDLDDEAKSILRYYSQVDMELYKAADEMAKTKTTIAKDCLSRLDNPKL